MTIWQPRIAERSRPKYLAIAEALADDVASGQLAPGARLPTHRALALSIGVTVGTVTRAYAEARRQGLIAGEVGRGTYVVGGGADRPPLAVAEETSPNVVDFSLNLPASGEGERRLRETLAAMATGRLAPLMDYQPDVGIARHRAAGQAWVRRAGVEAAADRIVVTNGAQHGMAAVFMAIASPGDTILTESLTYHGMKELAEPLRLRLHGLPMDADGLLPDAFADACRLLNPRALYCMPNLHNPTAAVMGESRRRAIVEIARRHDVILVEDDVYGFLLGDAQPPPLAALAPERTYHVTSLSKSAATGLRLGYVVAPEREAARIGAAVRVTCRMATPLMAEIAARWIADGTADALADFQRREVAARREIAERALAGVPLRTHPKSLHLWIPLPEPWRAEAFVGALKAQGVVVLPAEAFVVGRVEPPHAVRVCLGAARDRAAVAKGLSVLAAALDAAPQPTAAVV